MTKSVSVVSKRVSSFWNLHLPLYKFVLSPFKKIIDNKKTRDPREVTQGAAGSVGGFEPAQTESENTAREWHLKVHVLKLFRYTPEEREGFCGVALSGRGADVSRCQGTVAAIRRGTGGVEVVQCKAGLLVRMNGLIQVGKSRVRGYRTTKNPISMISLIGAKLKFPLPV